MLDDSVTSEERVRDWSFNWGTGAFDKEVKGEPVGPRVKCFLNADVADVPTLDCSEFWAENRMFGTISGLPVHWLSCIPIMSYLMYIPRLWGVFYSKPRVLPKLSQISKRSMSPSMVIREIIGPTNRSENNAYQAQLWTYLAHRLMLPLWFTPCGKENFWTFTYLLIKYALSKSLTPLARPAGLPEALCSEEATSGGYQAWSHWYALRGDAPRWFSRMQRELHNLGPAALIYFGFITGYI